MSRAVLRHKATFPFAIQKLYRDTSHVTCTARRVAACTCALLRRIAVCLAAPCHDTKFCIVTHPQWPSRARTLPLAPRAGRPFCGPLLAVSWRFAGPVMAPWCAPSSSVSRYNLLYRDLNWKMGSNPSSLPNTSFFFFYSSNSFPATPKMQ